MPQISFTDSKVNELRLPRGRAQQDHFERLYKGRSLILTVGRASKAWSVMWYEGGSPKRKKLRGGEWPSMDTDTARKAALEFNPDAERKRAAAGTFGQVYDNYLVRVVNKDAFVSAPELKRLITSHVLPRWRGKKMTDIDLDACTELFDAIEDKHGAGVADSVLAVVNPIFSWHASRTSSFKSPVGLKRRKKTVKRKRALSNEEISQLWETTAGPGTYNSIVRMLLLTGQRRTKVAEMRWSDVDLETGEWKIPKRPREKSVMPAITLPPVALDIVRSQPRFANNGYVFAGRRGSFSGWSKSNAHLRDKLDFEQPWRLHDLRRTARRLLPRLEVLTETSEALLGHSLRGIVDVYDDLAEYRGQVDRALVRLEAEVLRIVSSKGENNVTQFPA